MVDALAGDPVEHETRILHPHELAGALVDPDLNPVMDGRAGISRKHALALVNRGGATTAELVALARELRDGVMETCGVELRPEPTLVGIEL